MSHRSPLFAAHLVFMLFTLFTSSTQALQTLTVSAGEIDRSNSIVRFTVDSQMRGGIYMLRSDDGEITAMEIGPGPQGAFILGELKAGQSRTYRVEKAGPAPEARREGVEVSRQGDRLIFTGNGKSQIFEYQGGKTRLPEGYEPHYARGGYIHPVWTPGGRQITDDFPPKHKHHHGIWSPWTKTRFEGRTPDFWNMQSKTGTVEFVRIGDIWPGPISGGFTADHRMIDLSSKDGPKPAINETWDVRVYRPFAGERPMFIFDWTTTQTCATASPLILPKYHYGGLGFRGHREWDGKDNCVFLTSEGKGRANGNETTGKWCHVGGKVDGEPAGVAILCHPENFRFPQPMRLHPDEPFFCFAPSQGGDWSIQPGKPYVARYRFVVADGPADAKEIERLWTDYAHPPKVKVE